MALALLTQSSRVKNMLLNSMVSKKGVSYAIPVCEGDRSNYDLQITEYMSPVLYSDQLISIL